MKLNSPSKTLWGGVLLINADDLIEIINWAKKQNLIKIGSNNQAKVYKKEM